MMPPRTRKRRAPEPSPINKQVLAKAVARILEDEQMTQTEAAYRAKDAPSQLSLIVTGKVAGFSSERLMRVLMRLGRDVDIVIRKSKGRSGKIRTVVK